MLDLTVSLVNYNGDTEDLKETIKSLYKAWPNAYLCIHDNGSQKENLDELRSFRHDQLIEGTNKGFGYGHNRAFEACPKSKFHLILNPDILIKEDCLEKLISFMDSAEDVVLTVPKIFNEDGSVQMLNKRQPCAFNQFARRFLPKFVQNLSPIRAKMDHYIMLDKGYDQSYEVPYMSGCFMLFRSEVLEKLKGFDEDFFMYMEDADISRRASELGRCVFYPQASIVHKWGRGSHKSLKLTWISIKSSLLYFKKWGL